MRWQGPRSPAISLCFGNGIISAVNWASGWDDFQLLLPTDTQVRMKVLRMVQNAVIRPYIRRLHVLFLCIVMAPLLVFGCAHYEAKPIFEEANDFFTRGSYQASLGKYEEIIMHYPMEGDRVLFEMGMIHAHPRNDQKDYDKAAECFGKVIQEYPASTYRKDSEMMLFNITAVMARDAVIARKQAFIDEQQVKLQNAQQEVQRKASEILALQQKIEELEQKHLSLVLKNASADKILIEKKERRLTLLSKGDVLKIYRVALGGNPDGPKERQGDGKTPEGNYFIASRNRDSQYHLSLHISYPNEKDRKRARELGVSPGGNIMIHGIKKGFSWVGDMHTGKDWTQGCIAVTDEEIEEIAQLVKDGTAVEIRP